MAQIEFQQDTMVITGEMTFSTVISLLESSKQLFAEPIIWKCDFSKVTTCDSAGFALLLEWKKWAKQQNKTLQFLNLPAQAQAIAAATGLSI